VKFKGRDAVDGVRVKERERHRDLDLYARGGSGRQPKHKEVRNTTPERAHVREAIVREPARQVKVRESDSSERKVHRIDSGRTKVERQPVKVRKIDSKQTKIERQPVKVRKVESTLTKLRKALTKRVKEQKADTKRVKQARSTKSRSSAKQVKKQVAPKVRTKNQGRSPATRRRVSR
jgi:hypothetical protein